MHRSPRRILIGVAFLGLLVVGLALLLARRPAPLEWPKPPSPNGYPQLVQLGLQLQQDGWPATDSEGHPDLPAAAPPEYVVDEVRKALQQPCAVPSEPTMDYAMQRGNDLAALKRLSQALSAQAQLEFQSGRTNTAAELGVDLLRLAAAMMRHGLMIDVLAAQVPERMGCEQLEQARPGMSRETLRQTLDTVTELEPTLSDAQMALALDEQFFRQNTPGIPRLVFRLQELVGRSPLTGGRAKFLNKHWAATVALRRTQLRLAARLCELERGHGPAAVSDLVPGFLPAVPVDPASGEPLVLVLDESNAE